MEGRDSEWDGLPEPFPIHFDVPGHQIPLATFIETARQTENIFRSFNQHYFGGKVQFQVVVLPTEEGSFLSRLGIVLLAGWTVIWGFTESDIGKAFIKGLTTEAPAHWAEIAGATLREALSHPEAVDTEAAEKEGQCRYGAVIMAEVARGFLQKETSELEQIGLSPSTMRDAFAAKNEFYDVCAATPGLRAIGFDESPVFPVPKVEFGRLQVSLPPETEGDDDPWLTATVVLKVTSPNWDRHDKQRQWKGRDARNHERYFKIEDEHFWGLVKADRLNTHIIDTIKVQWAYRGTSESPRACRVLKVLEYNQKVLSKPLDENALSSILGLFEAVIDDQGDLFDGDEQSTG